MNDSSDTHTFWFFHNSEIAVLSLVFSWRLMRFKWHAKELEEPQGQPPGQIILFLCRHEAINYFNLLYIRGWLYLCQPASSMPWHKSRGVLSRHRVGSSSTLKSSFSFFFHFNCLSLPARVCSFDVWQVTLMFDKLLWTCLCHLQTVELNVSFMNQVPLHSSRSL